MPYFLSPVHISPLNSENLSNYLPDISIWLSNGNLEHNMPKPRLLIFIPNLQLQGLHHLCQCQCLCHPFICQGMKGEGGTWELTLICHSLSHRVMSFSVSQSDALQM